MNRKNIIVLSIILVLALLIGAVCMWFDQNWNRQEIVGNESPSWREPDPLQNPTQLEPSSKEDPSDAQEESSGEQTADTPKVVAPDFTVYDAEGKPVQLSDFLGKPVVLNFWASWCAPCKNEMPDFQQMYEQYGDDVQFLMINLTDNVRETVESANTFITERGYSFPVFYDLDTLASTAYNIRSIPTSFFIDAEGYAIAQATGIISAENLQKGIDLIYTPSAEEVDETPDA